MSSPRPADMIVQPSRRRAAAAFATVGVLAGAAHVLATEPESVRLWRETLPLAGLVGATLGALVRPADWKRGALFSLLATPAFALAYAVAETVMMATRGEIAGAAAWMRAIFDWMIVVLRQAAFGAIAATLGGAAAGHLLGRNATRSTPP